MSPAWFERAKLEMAAVISVSLNLAIAYPVLDLLGRNAEFFVAHGASRTTVILIALLLTVVLPGTVTVAVLVCRLLSPKIAGLLYGAAVGLFFALLSTQVLKRTLLDSILPPQALLALATALGFAAVGLLLRYVSPLPNTVLGFSLAVPLLVVVLFGLTDVRGMLFPGDKSIRTVSSVNDPTPVVMVVFDELPVASLLDKHLNIDSFLFPNFASIAEDGTWYRNTTSVASHTRWAVPALVTGYDPPRSTLPTADDHPDNLFSLLGESYQVYALESMTALCPPSVCSLNSEPDVLGSAGRILKDIVVVVGHLLAPSQWAARLPAIDERWANFAETPQSGSFTWDGDARLGDLVGQFRTWLGDLPKGDSDNVLFFAHSLLVHRPWRYLPGGYEYPNVLFAGLGKEGWTNDPWLMAQAYQRHLLQIQAADTLLGELLFALKRDGRYDGALVIVTADHGISMQPGTNARAPRENSLVGIAGVPLIIKYPHQTQGSVQDWPAQTVDVLPTIAEVVDMNPRPSVEGTSLMAKSGVEARPRVMAAPAGPLKMPVDIRSDLGELVDTKAKLLSEVTNLFRLAPPQTGHLLGRSIADMAISPQPAPFNVEIIDANVFDAVDLNGPVIPALIGASLDSRLPLNEQVNVVLVVNGRIAAITRTLTRGGKQRPSEFSAMIDPGFLKSGKNDISVFLLDDHDILRPIRILTAES